MKRSIRIKLLLSFALIGSLCIIIQTVAFSLTHRYIEEQTRNDLAMKAKDAANEVDILLSDLEKEASSVGVMYQNSTPTTQQEIITAVRFFLNNNTYIKKVSILSPTGKEWFRYEGGGVYPKEKLSIELPSDQFDKALAGKKAFSKVYNLGSVFSPHIDAFFPIVNKERKVSIVVKMQVRVEDLWAHVSRISHEKGSYAYAVDHDGILIAHPDAQFLMQKPNLSNRKLIFASLNNDTSKLRPEDYIYTNEKKKQVVAGAARVTNTDWLIVFAEPTETAFAFLNLIQRIFFATFIGTSILLIVIATYLSKYITYSILQLQKFTKQLTDGDFTTRISLQTGDEIESLATSFNTLAFNLEEAFSKLKNDKETLSAERNKMAVALSSIADSVIVVDLQRRIVVFNKAAEQLVGLSTESVLGKPINSILRVYDKHDEVDFSQFCPIRNDTFEGTVFTLDNLRIVSHEGKEFYANVVAGKIKDSETANVGCILVLHNVTNEKELEEMKLDFVSMAAHELRTPLTSIRGYLSVFLEENLDKFTDEQKTFLKRMSIASEQLMALVENLLNVTRIEQGAMTLNAKPIDWIDCIKNAIDGLSERAKQKNITLSFIQPDNQIPNVKADTFRVGEVLTNLIANAINYTQQGGSITISIEKQGDMLVTHVTDTGEGISEEALNHLFTKFFRVSGKLEQGSKGTGLGLYISKAIIEMHQGKIWVESTVGKGSIFSFSLPTA